MAGSTVSVQDMDIEGQERGCQKLPKGRRSARGGLGKPAGHTDSSVRPCHAGLESTGLWTLRIENMAGGLTGSGDDAGDREAGENTTHTQTHIQTQGTCIDRPQGVLEHLLFLSLLMRD